MVGRYSREELCSTLPAVCAKCMRTCTRTPVLVYARHEASALGCIQRGGRLRMLCLSNLPAGPSNSVALFCTFGQWSTLRTGSGLGVCVRVCVCALGRVCVCILMFVWVYMYVCTYTGTVFTAHLGRVFFTLTSSSFENSNPNPEIQCNMHCVWCGVMCIGVRLNADSI